MHCYRMNSRPACNPSLCNYLITCQHNLVKLNSSYLFFNGIIKEMNLLVEYILSIKHYVLLLEDVFIFHA